MCVNTNERALVRHTSILERSTSTLVLVYILVLVIVLVSKRVAFSSLVRLNLLVSALTEFASGRNGFTRRVRVARSTRLVSSQLIDLCLVRLIE